MDPAVSISFSSACKGQKFLPPHDQLMNSATGTWKKNNKKLVPSTTTAGAKKRTYTYNVPLELHWKYFLLFKPEVLWPNHILSTYFLATLKVYSSQHLKRKEIVV